jgi:hypothetical protein
MEGQRSENRLVVRFAGFSSRNSSFPGTISGRGGEVGLISGHILAIGLVGSNRIFTSGAHNLALAENLIEAYRATEKGD